MPSDAAPNDPATPAELEEAGRIVEGAVRDMFERKFPPQVIASSLLGATLHVLANSLPEENIIRILEKALAGARSGQLRQFRR